MDAATHHLVEAIHQAPAKGVVTVTGGGTGAVAQLLGVPGASRTILEAIVPYHEQALIEFLGQCPDSFCSDETGCKMAVRAFERACWLAPGEAVFGLGCTASLATDRPKKGDHRFHAAIYTAERVHSCSAVLTKGARDRAGEEAVLDAVLMNMVAEAAGADGQLAMNLVAGERLEEERQARDDALLALLQGTIPLLCVEPDGRLRRDVPLPKLIMPGSFNPAHAGHFGMATAAARLTGLQAAFELSVLNVDKPPLSQAEVRGRLQEFFGQAPLWLTRAPTFLEKAHVFPGAVFIVGFDTAERILAPRYYQDCKARMLEALAQIHTLGCRFLVAGRADQGTFRTLSDLAVPESCRGLFQAMPEREFRLDMSSTSLRHQCR